MKIETKFDIDDVVATTPNSLDNLKAMLHDFEGINVFKIKEIIAQICYGGNQVFYWVTPIRLKETRNGVIIKEGILVKDVSNIVPGTNMLKYREDELEKISLKTLIIDIDKLTKKDDKK